MTTRTTTPLVCACGHKGALRTAENDAPYSTEWFQREVEGFTDHGAGFDTRDMTCPICHRRGEVRAA